MISLRERRRAMKLEEKYCGSCRLYGQREEDPDKQNTKTAEENTDCLRCYGAAVGGSYHYPIIRKYIKHGSSSTDELHTSDEGEK